MNPADEQAASGAPVALHAGPVARRALPAGPCLLAILAAGALLRLPLLTQAPPGLNQDEAANAWNAWCLLKTGKDQAGVSWPVLYLHALGENRSALYVYTLLPFQLVGGLNVWTTRLPAATGGVLTLLLVYWIAARLFDRPTGLVAAALLAINRWHVNLSRFGHEASLTPLLVTASVAAWLWAGLPPRDRDQPAVWWKALIAGLFTGVACYGYPAVRILLPLLLATCMLIGLPTCLRAARRRERLLALGALMLGFALTFGPLAYEHLAHPDQIARRATGTWLWSSHDTFSTKASLVAARYAAHFGPDFLFEHGDYYESQWPAGFGMYGWYILPLALTGLISLLARAPSSVPSRLLLCWLLLYPAGDCLSSHLIGPFPDQPAFQSLHALRSAPGLVAPLLLAAVGAPVLAQWLWRKGRALALGALAVVTIAAGIAESRFLIYYFGPHNRQPPVYSSFHVDFVEACEWLRPRLESVDAVFVTTYAINMPYIVAVVALDYDPHEWFRDPPDSWWDGEYDRYRRVGKLRFFSDPLTSADLDRARVTGRPTRMVFITRPGETSLPNPAYVVRGPDGNPLLELFEIQY